MACFKTRLTLLILFVGLIVGANSFAYAQSDDDPVTLAPQPLELPAVSSEDSGDGSDAADDEGGSTWSTTTTPSVVIGAGGGSIEVNELQTLGADMAGVLTEDSGGFAPDVWRGTPRRVVDHLFSVMPVHTPSPAMRDLMRRLFMTQAIPPDNGSGEDGGFIAQRLELLAAMGDVESVEELLAVTPGRKSNERFVRIETGIHLVHGDFVNVCALVDGPGKESADDYWQQLMIFCEALSGAHPQAQLGLSLLREVGVEDPIYYQMLDAMMAGEVPILEDIEGLSSLHIGIIRASRARLAPDVAIKLPPAILSAVASNADLDDMDRLTAAEQAAITGVLAIDDLRSLYDGIAFEEEVLTNPLTAIETLEAPLSRALLYQVANRQTVDGARAEVAFLALESAHAAGLYAVTAQVFNDVIKQVPPRTDLIWFSGHAVRALAIAADAPAASGWLGLLRVNATLSEEAALTLVQLVPVMRLAGLDEGAALDGAAINAWRKADEVTPGSRDRAVLFYSLLESLGHPVEPSAWDALGYAEVPNELTEVAENNMNAADELPDPVLWQRLVGAARSGITGETALLALATLGDMGASGAHPLAISHVVQAMTLVGLETEARTLAVEAALAAGL